MSKNTGRGVRAAFSGEACSALPKMFQVVPPRRGMVGVTGVEPVTLRLSSACSNQLSYTPEAAWPLFQNATRVPVPRLVELRRVELLTYSLQSYRSTN